MLAALLAYQISDQDDCDHCITKRRTGEPDDNGRFENLEIEEMRNDPDGNRGREACHYSDNEISLHHKNEKGASR